MMDSVSPSPPASFFRVPIPPSPPSPGKHNHIHNITYGRRRRRRRRRRIRLSRSSSQYIRCFKVLVLVAVENRRHHGFFSGVVRGIAFLAKTKETFRLAELQKLEAQMMMTMTWERRREENHNDDSDSDNGNGKDTGRIDRLLIDESTGSSLFRIESLSDYKNHPFFEKRCDWIGQVEVEGRDVSEMIDRIHLLLDSTNEGKTDLIKDGWSLDYIRMYQPPRPHAGKKSNDENDEDTDDTSTTNRAGTAGTLRQTSRHRGQTNKKSVICAVANVISSRPALHINDVTTKLLVVDCSSSGYEDVDNDEEKKMGCYLVRIIDHQNSKQNDDDIGHTSLIASTPTSLQKGVWSKRPFQYSSALNFEVAEVIIDMLLSAVVSSSKRCRRQLHFPPQSSLSLHLLDPTCGSGTLLAMALSKGFQFVEGYDVNPSCVDGSLKNLKYVFGSDIVQAMTHVSVRDSSIEWTSSLADDDAKDNKVNALTTTPPSCVVANLPWGQNTISYVDENRRILNAIRGRLSKGTFCVFITRPDTDISSPSIVDRDNRNIGCSLWKNHGFDEIGHAYIPQRDFVVPKGRKKREENSETRRNASSTSTQVDSSLCRVSVVVAT